MAPFSVLPIFLPSLFSGGGDIIPTVTLNLDKDVSILDLCVLVNFATSKSEARRLIVQGGLILDESKVNDVNLLVPLTKLSQGVKLKKGKKNFIKAINK